MNMHSFGVTIFQIGFEKCTFQIRFEKCIVFFLFDTLFKLDLKSALVHFRNAERTYVERVHYESRAVERTKKTLNALNFCVHLHASRLKIGGVVCIV